MADTPLADEPPPTFSTLDFDVTRSIVSDMDAASLARLRSVGHFLKELVDSISADLHARRLRECRLRACGRSFFLPNNAPSTRQPGFVGIHGKGGVRLLGGMCCGGASRRRSLHSHILRGFWVAASYCGNQALLLRADGSVVGSIPGLAGAKVGLDCDCDAKCDGTDGAGAEEEEEETDEVRFRATLPVLRC